MSPGIFEAGECSESHILTKSQRQVPLTGQRISCTQYLIVSGIGAPGQTAYHLASVTNGPTEGPNNLINRAKQVGFGFTNFKNFQIRELLYAGNLNSGEHSNQ